MGKLEVKAAMARDGAGMLVVGLEPERKDSTARTMTLGSWITRAN